MLCKTNPIKEFSVKARNLNSLKFLHKLFAAKVN